MIGAGRSIGRDALVSQDVAGKAMLIRTGWDRHWRTDAHFTGHPFLTAEVTNLAALPGGGYRFTAVPVKVAGMGTFPVRAYATLDT